MPSSSVQILPFNPGLPLARVSAMPGDFAIDARSSHTVRAYAFDCGGCAADFARALRDEGGWRLRFGPGCEGVATAVAELDEAAA